MPEYVLIGAAALLVLMWTLRALSRRGKEDAAPSDGQMGAEQIQQAITDDKPPDVSGLGFDLVLTYTSVKGETLKRHVTVREAWGYFGQRGGFELHSLIRAHCHLRQEVRTFHVLGMDQLTDPASGEVVTGLRTIERWLSRRIGAEVKAGRGRRMAAALLAAMLCAWPALAQPAQQHAVAAPRLPPPERQPEDQRRFLAALEALFREDLRPANAIAPDTSWQRRAAAICQAMPGLEARDWIGAMQTIQGGGPNGEAAVAVEIARGIRIGTGYGPRTSRGTMIARGTPLYAAIQTLRLEQPVRVSGSFFRDAEDCIAEVMRRQFRRSVREPEFLFRFTEIRPLE